MQNSQFDKKIVTITGGTGSFGNVFARKLLQSNIAEVRVFSRDEKKQDDMRSTLQDDRVRFYLGDVRDQYSVSKVMDGADFVFHAAALKQVPSCEFFPMEAVKTNIIGTENVVNACINCGVKRLVCLSTDKAVYPINAMGISKAMMEKIAIAGASRENRLVINVTRYGNVMASRGSVIPKFLAQIDAGDPITITDWNMTRFMMTLEDAIELVEYAFLNGTSGDLFVMKAPAASLRTLSQAICHLQNYSAKNVLEIGSRHGEKLHEVLVSGEEMAKAIDLGKFLKIPKDDRTLNYKNYEQPGSLTLSGSSEFSSENTFQLNINQMIEQLRRLDFAWRKDV